ncbi:MAG: phosphoglycerate dehydrogenase [Chthonomonadales bacterium]
MTDEAPTPRKQTPIPWTILLTARALWTTGRDALLSLEEAGCTLRDGPRTGPIDEDTLIAALDGCDAVIASIEPYTARVFAACPGLKLVARCGVGYDAVDVQAATEAGVMVATTPGAVSDAVADYTLGLAIALARHIPELHQKMRSGGWGGASGVLVTGKTIGIIGVGNIGKAVAHRAAGFQMRILGYDPALSEPPKDAPSMELTSLHRLLAESDFVALCAPATSETRHIINADRLAQMKPTAFLINTARGSLVDEEALVAALHAGQIAGAALDVFEHEPLPPDHPLRQAPNVILSPHNAFNAAEAAAAMGRRSVENVLAAMQGRVPPGLLNAEVLQSPALRTRVAGR